jgi:hypothetical protein
MIEKENKLNILFKTERQCRGDMAAEANMHRAERNFRTNKYQSWYIKHNYDDHSQDGSWSKNGCIDIHKSKDAGKGTSRGFSSMNGKKSLFPSKLHELLKYSEVNGYTDIVSWQIHGRAFKIHKAKDFVEKIMPNYFQQTKMASFRRQLSLYGFLRITQGYDKGAYYHELFLHGMDFLARKITSQRLKGTFVKGLAHPETEPDFYSMQFATKNATVSKESRNALEPSTEPENSYVPMSSPNQIITPADRKSVLIECGTLHYTNNMSTVGEVGFEKMTCNLQQFECNIFLDDWDLNSFSVTDDDSSIFDTSDFLSQDNESSSLDDTFEDILLP